MEYILENEQLKVTVTTWGAQVKSVIRKEDGVEHIWQADKSVWVRTGSHRLEYSVYECSRIEIDCLFHVVSSNCFLLLCFRTAGYHPGQH